MELDEIRAVVREKTKTHPELGEPLTYGALRRVLEREHIGWMVRAIPRPAQLVPYLDTWTIVVDVRQSERQYAYLGAHELGHLWLHHDRFFDRTETRVYNMSESWNADPEEDDAEIFATMVLAGPNPEQWTPLDPLVSEPRPDPAPRTLPPARAIPRSLQIELDEAEWMPPRRRRGTLERERSGEWFFIDDSGKSWRLYDVSFAGARREVLALGDPRAIARIFVRPRGEPNRIYRFKRGDRHELSSPLISHHFRDSQ